MTIRQPRLLKPDLTEQARLSPVKLSFHLHLSALSEAEMVLPDDAPGIHLQDLIELCDENGSTGIFRVSHISQTFRRTRTIHLEHSLAILRDTVMPAQGFTGSVQECLSLLLSRQNLRPSPPHLFPPSRSFSPQNRKAKSPPPQKKARKAPPFQTKCPQNRTSSPRSRKLSPRSRKPPCLWQTPLHLPSAPACSCR